MAIQLGGFQAYPIANGFSSANSNRSGGVNRSFSASGEMSLQGIQGNFSAASMDGNQLKVGGKSDSGMYGIQKSAGTAKTSPVECQTCKNRTYQDGSNDPGVSFKTPGHIDPSSSGAVVMAHEQEHVKNAKADADASGGKIVSSSVKLQTAICPECGRVYVSGGTTTTTTSTPSKSTDAFTENYKKVISSNRGVRFDAKG
jgi:hypothetical protein